MFSTQSEEEFLPAAIGFISWFKIGLIRLLTNPFDIFLSSL